MGVFKPVFEQFRGLKSLDCEYDSWYNKIKLDMFTSGHRTWATLFFSLGKHLKATNVHNARMENGR
jgi:hypothetical protein